MTQIKMILIAVYVVKVIIVIITIFHASKTMKEINTDYKYYFGLGVILLLSTLLSLFHDEWIKTVNTLLWCMAIYLFLQILVERNIKK